ncbi:MAG TPA: oxidoreductase, partial [Clostridiales bacterium]|nr:oxidoreductase [Clostridiales bacterium]
HNVCEMNIDMYLDRSYGIYDYLMEQKKNGRIKHLGFSCHGEPDILQRFLDAYGDDMEFCQLQLNYLDWTFQYGEKKVKMLSDRNIPVWVMEPLRGGKLVGLDPAFRERLDSSGRRESPQAWAFRFLQTIPETGVILSGMSDMEQLKDNINIFSEDRPLDGDEFDLLLSIADDMLGRKTIPCTGCSYCVSHCPMELDIPYLISLYNEHAFTEGGFLAPMALAALPDDKQPGSCVGCTSCEQVCPQNIKISEIMADFADRL